MSSVCGIIQRTSRSGEVWVSLLPKPQHKGADSEPCQSDPGSTAEGRASLEPIGHLDTNQMIRDALTSSLPRSKCETVELNGLHTGCVTWCVVFLTDPLVLRHIPCDATRVHLKRTNGASSLSKPRRTDLFSGATSICTGTQRVTHPVCPSMSGADTRVRRRGSVCLLL